MQPCIRDLGCRHYSDTLLAMQAFTAKRGALTRDEIWLVEHPAVFTLGRAANPAHVLSAHNIPVVETDRGGQVTYHGEGQCVVYFLIDIKRQKAGIKAFVAMLEQLLIVFLARLDIQAHVKVGQPGVYVNDAKIASIGLRVKKGCTYHGIALNVAMDLTPFAYINPCGFPGLKVVQVRDFNPAIHLDGLKAQLVSFLRLTPLPCYDELLLTD